MLRAPARPRARRAGRSPRRPRQAAAAEPRTLKSIWGPNSSPTAAPRSRSTSGSGSTCCSASSSGTRIATTRPADPRDPDDPAYEWPADVDAATRAAPQSRLQARDHGQGARRSGRTAAKPELRARPTRATTRTSWSRPRSATSASSTGWSGASRTARGNWSSRCPRTRRGPRVVRAAARPHLRLAEEGAQVEQGDRRHDAALLGDVIARGLAAVDAAAQRQAAAAGLVRAQPVHRPPARAEQAALHPRACATCPTSTRSPARSAGYWRSRHVKPKLWLSEFCVGVRPCATTRSPSTSRARRRPAG